MESRNWTLHIVASVVLAFALSVVFWLAWDVFVLAGFILWSLASGIVGGVVGTLVSKRIFLPLLFTAVIRVVVFVILSGVFF